MANGFFGFFKGIRLFSKTSSDASNAGEIEVVGSKVQIHNGSSSSPVVTEDHAATLTNKTISDKLKVASGSGKGIDVSAAGDLEIGVSVGANDLIVGGATTAVHIPGDLIVDGTASVGGGSLSTNDPHIELNVSGNDAAAEGGGIKLHRTGTYGSIAYENALASKWKIGDLGSESEIATVSDTQTLTNKTLTTPTISSITNGGTVTIPSGTDTLVAKNTTDTLTNKTLALSNNTISSTANRAAQFNASTGVLEPSSVTDTELGYVSGVTSAIQTQLDNKQPTGNYITALSSDVTASGPGSASATVNSVGGSSAANVHAAELLANAATSSNTPSTIVKRGASGEFIAGAVTADSLALTTDLAIADGGTGASTAIGAKQNLGAQDTFNGIEDKSLFSMAYDAAARTLTVTYSVGAAVWVSGVRYVKSGSEVTTAHAGSTGKFFFYYNASGNLTVSSSTWDLLVTAPLALVYYKHNATPANAKAIVFDERHPAGTGMADATHRYAHANIGTQLGSGATISGYTLTTAGAAALSYAIGSATISDEDLIHSGVALADGGPYMILWGDSAAGATWDWDMTSVTGILDDGTDIVYNNIAAGTKVALAGTANANYWPIALPFYATVAGSIQTARSPGFAVIMGQNTYANTAAAQAVTPTALIGISNFTEEGVIFARITYQRNAANSPSHAQIQTDPTYFKGNVLTVSGGSFTPTDHQSLSNRTATNAHPASSILASTVNKAIVSDSSGNLTTSTTSSTELDYVSGVTSAIQTQLDGKQATGNYVTSLTGDVTASGPGASAATIANNVVSNAKLAQMAAHTFKGNNTAGAADPSDLTATQLTAELNNFVGDSGAGGTKGLVPAPAAGDAAAGKVLKADGSWGAAGTTSPLTTKGDLYTYSTTNDRLPIGTHGQVLKANALSSTGLAWSRNDSSGINYIPYGSAEVGATTGFATYSDAAGTSPVDATGGGIFSDPGIDITSSSPLRGTYSFIFTKGTSNRQGRGLSYDFTIDAADQARVLTIESDYSFEYTYASSATFTVTIASPAVFTSVGHGYTNGQPLIFSTTGALPTGLVAGTTYYVINRDIDTFQVSSTVGGAAINTSGTQSGTHTSTPIKYTTGDLTVWVYDVTNAVLIPAVPSSIEAIEPGTYGRMKMEFQSSYNSTSYRLAFHITTTSTSGWKLKFDNLQVGPRAKVFGAPVTDWQSFTPTGSWVTNTTYSGFYRRVGDSAEVQFKVLATGAPTATALTVSLPSGLTIDTSKISTGINGYSVVGQAAVNDSGVENYNANVSINNTTSVGLFAIGAAGTYANAPGVTASVPIASTGANDTVTGYYTVPILGWSSSTQMSDSANTRVYGFSASGAPTLTSGHLSFPTIITDTHGSSYSSGVLTIKNPGWYTVSGAFYISGSGTGGYATLYPKKNGTTIGVGFTILNVGVAQSNVPFISGTTPIFYANAGDTITIDPDTNFTSPSYTSGYFSIEQKLGPSSIAASDTVHAEYYTGQNRTVNNTAPTIVFESKREDSNGMYNTSTGVLTIPVSGVYLITAYGQFGIYNATAASTVQLTVKCSNSTRNGVIASYRTPAANASYLSEFAGSMQRKFLAGETIEIGGYSDVATATYGSGLANRFEITRIGNY